MPGSPKELQDKIHELLGLDWNGFRSTLMFGQRDTARFIHPETSDKDRKDILHRIVSTGVYGLALDWVKQEAKGVKAKVQTKRDALAANRARLEELDLDELKASVKRWEEKRAARKQEATDTARELVAEAKRLKEEVPDTSAMESRLAEAQEARERSKALRRDVASKQKLVNELAVQHQNAANELRSHRADEARAQTKLDKLDGERCDLCHSSLEKGEAAKHIEHLREIAKDAEKMLATAEELMDAKEKALKKAKKELAGLEAELSTADELADEAGDLTEKIAEARNTTTRATAAAARARDALKTAKTIAKEENPHTASLERARKRRVELKETIEKEEGELEALVLDAAHWEFWVKGLGPSGLPSFALDVVIPLLTERANHYLETLSDGDITMEFSSQRELKSAKGEFRDEISINWEIEGIKNFAPSGGQWKKMEIATDFALMDLLETREGARPDLLLLDEVFDGLDAEGIDRVGELLQKMRKKRGTILVISHATTMQEWFERAVIVKKTDGVSALEAA